MKECEPDEPSPSPPSIPADNVLTVHTFNNVLCYIVHSFFPFRSFMKSKKSDMRRLTENRLGTIPSASASETGSVEQSDTPAKKTTKCRLPMFIRRKKGKSEVQQDEVKPKNDEAPPPQAGPAYLAVGKMNDVSEHASVISESKSLSCHLLVTPKISKIQRIPLPKKVKIDTKITMKTSPVASREVQVRGRTVPLDTYTTQLEIIPPSRGDSDSVNTPSPTRPYTSNSSLTKRSIQKKRTFPSINPPLVRTKTVASALKQPIKPSAPVQDDTTKPMPISRKLRPPAKTVAARRKISATDSSQTLESWPVLQKQLSLFQRTKRKLSLERKKPAIISTHVQAVQPRVQRSNVKCLVSIDQGTKGTLAMIGPSGLERLESCMNTETNDSSTGIQCDIAMHRSRTPKRIISSRKMEFKPFFKNTPAVDKKKDEGVVQPEGSKVAAKKTVMVDKAEDAGKKEITASSPNLKKETAAAATDTKENARVVPPHDSKTAAKKTVMLDKAENADIVQSDKRKIVACSPHLKKDIAAAAADTKEDEWVVRPGERRTAAKKIFMVDKAENADIMRSGKRKIAASRPDLKKDTTAVATAADSKEDIDVVQRDKSKMVAKKIVMVDEGESANMLQTDKRKIAVSSPDLKKVTAAAATAADSKEDMGVVQRDESKMVAKKSVMVDEGESANMLQTDKRKIAASSPNLMKDIAAAAADTKEDEWVVQPDASKIAAKEIVMVDKAENADIVQRVRRRIAASTPDLKKAEDVKEVVQPEKSEVTASDSEKNDLVTVLSRRVIDPRLFNSETICREHHECLEFKPTDDDPLHCLNEFISLEQMLRRLQEEIHGLDTSIREISTNYQFPATLTTTPPASVHSKLKSAANVVKNYQKELDTTHEQFSSAYWNHSLNEYL